MISDSFPFSSLLLSSNRWFRRRSNWIDYSYITLHYTSLFCNYTLILFNDFLFATLHHNDKQVVDSHSSTLPPSLLSFIDCRTWMKWSTSSPSLSSALSTFTLKVLYTGTLRPLTLLEQVPPHPYSLPYPLRLLFLILVPSLLSAASSLPSLQPYHIRPTLLQSYSILYPILHLWSHPFHPYYSLISELHNNHPPTHITSPPFPSLPSSHLRRSVEADWSWCILRNRYRCCGLQEQLFLRATWGTYVPLCVFELCFSQYHVSRLCII